MSKPLKIFGSLISEVIRKGLCTYCGTCMASCPVNILVPTEEEKPTMKGVCNLCELCYYGCPRVELPLYEIEKKIFGKVRTINEDLIGVTKGIYKAKSTDEEILNACQDGGVATSLLLYAIEKGFVDFAVVTKGGSKNLWKPEPFLAFKKAELLEASKSKYSPSASVSMIADAALGYPNSKIAFIGLPCQIHGIRRLQTSFKGNKKIGDHVAITLGIFCEGSFHYKKLFIETLQANYNLDLKSIDKFEIAKNNFKAYKRNETILELPLSDILQFLIEGCKKCQDFTAELADISIGNAGSPKGWCTVLTRSEAGEKLFKEACDHGLLEYEPLESSSLTVLEKLSKIKKMNEAPYIKT
ncbi:MAG: Coenzyme F420 hydrogenase/dehydrogenase, beta subunit C-terminal domain [Candidatus Bathyarchaeia archaeon]